MPGCRTPVPWRTERTDPGTAAWTTQRSGPGLLRSLGGVSDRQGRHRPLHVGPRVELPSAPSVRPDATTLLDAFERSDVHRKGRAGDTTRRELDRE